jgi:hypothetical protein
MEKRLLKKKDYEGKIYVADFSSPPVAPFVLNDRYKPGFKSDGLLTK